MLRRRRIPIGSLAGGLAVWLAVQFLTVPDAHAVPAFARRYDLPCSVCHSAWPVLNDVGWSFKLSGYRRLDGQDLQPTTKDIELIQSILRIPAIPPVAVVGTTGFDAQEIRRRAADGSRATQTGSSFDLDSAEIFVAAPLGEHLSTFLEFPLFETRIEHPTGPGGANATGPGSRRDIQFGTEVPGLEMAKILWNSLLPAAIAPPDSLNLVAGIQELPLAFSPEGRRLSATPYLVYDRRALDLLSPTPIDALLTGDEADRLLRLDEPQIGVELNGVLVPGGALTDLGRAGALALEYHLGVTNGSNKNADANREKDLFGRLVARWYGQALGVFGYWSPDIYDQGIRADGSIAPGTGGIFSGRQVSNSLVSAGPDLTLSLGPSGLPVWLDTQLLFNRESNPTGFDRRFAWWGGFTQLTGKLTKALVGYVRYDALRGDRFDDTLAGGVTGPVKPREWDLVGGLQWYIRESFKLHVEYSHRQFENDAGVPSRQDVREHFFTIRARVGF